jgi:hypothetical protein
MQAAERMISSDLEYLIEKAVDTKKADYAVFTGVQARKVPCAPFPSLLPCVPFSRSIVEV